MARRLMRMAELERLSGVPRETIHYYLREGLLPAPTRQGKTQALYDESHLERLRVVRQLREEKYLPVAVIRSILRAGLEARPSPDLDTLAAVLSIDPHLGAERTGGAPLSDEVLALAKELGLMRANESAEDPTLARVLATVAEAHALEGLARELTLEDLRASAPRVGELVEAEAAVFFDQVIQSGEMSEAVAALRRGRSTVARFIASYRDLTLRRIVDALIEAVSQASTRIEQASPLPLSAETARRLGADEQREKLSLGARRGDPAQANDLVWHLFALGPRGELARLPTDLLALLRPRAELLVVAANPESSLERFDAILSLAGSFPLGEVLAAERALVLALRGTEAGEGLLGRAVPALCRSYAADPGHDADPLASALAYLRRGLVGLALPKALGRSGHALGDLEASMQVVLSAPGRVAPAARAFIEGNARLARGRQLLSLGQVEPARAELRRALALDPSGSLGRTAESLVSEPVPEILAEPSRAR